MKKRKTNPKVQNVLLLIACIVLFLILGSFLFFNHKQEAANISELKKAAQEEIQKEKSDQTWTEDQNSEDQNNASQTDGNQNREDQNNVSQTDGNQNSENQNNTSQADGNQNSEDQAGENQTGENQAGEN